MSSLFKKSSFREIEKNILKATTRDLVIFDVDYTLISPIDKILRPCGETYVEEWIKKYNLDKNNTFKEEIISIVLKERSVEVVNRSFIDLIENLKKRSIPVMALTAIATKKYGIISSMEDWRINDLLQLGYDFSTSWPKKVSLKEFYDGTKAEPVFKQGILFTDYLEKGDTLTNFLKKTSINPAKIYFVDDMEKHLKSVYNALKKMGICFKGFLYQYLYSKDKNLSIDIAKKQLEILYHNKKWISENNII